jgi:hypothetical protein
VLASCHHFLHYNSTTEEDNDTLPLSSSSLQHHHKRKRQHITVVFFFSNIKKTNTHNKTTKKTKRREGAYLQTPALPSHFWLLLLPSRFCTFISNAFSLHFLLLKQKKKKTQRKKKNHRKENLCKEGKELTSSSHFASRFWLPLLPSRFCTSVSSVFSWHLLLLKQKKRKRT